MQFITTSSIEKHRDVYVRTEELASYISESATTYRVTNKQSCSQITKSTTAEFNEGHLSLDTYPLLFSRQNSNLASDSFMSTITFAWSINFFKLNLAYRTLDDTTGDLRFSCKIIF